MKKGGDSEKSSVPSTIQEVSEAPSSSPTISIEELTPSLRSFKGQDKGKLVFDFWNDPGLAVAKVHDVILMDELGRFRPLNPMTWLLNISTKMSRFVFRNDFFLVHIDFFIFIFNF